MTRYLQLASDNGYSDASYALALCRRDGNGVAQDIVEAKQLLQVATAQGHTDAKDLLDDL